MRRNPVPPLKTDATYAERLAWAKRTYAPGTAVKFGGGGYSWSVGPHVLDFPDFSKPTVLVPDETRGIVAGVVGDDVEKTVTVSVRVVDARSYAYAAMAPPGEKTSWMAADIHDMWSILDKEGTNVVSRYANGSLFVQALVPLDDNWASAEPKKRYPVARPRKTTSRRMRPNVIPPPPVYTGGPNNFGAILAWVSRTYAPGTHVEFMVKMWPNLNNGRTVEVPPGTRGRVTAITPTGDLVIKLLPAPYAGEEQQALEEELSRKGTDLLFLPYYSASNVHELRALDDNWAAAQSPKPAKRYALSPSQKRTSYKMRPNKRRTSRNKGRMRP